jgi:two-component sensor histidine kinase
MSQDAFERSEHADWRNRQAALADFGIQALRSFDLDTILQQGCVQVARGLDVPIAKVMQALPGQHELLLRATVGLPPDVAIPGETKVPSGGGSAAGYALTVDEPVVSHIPTETRFQVSEVVRRAQVVVSANVVIPTQDGPFGTLEVDSLEERRFSPEDIDFLRVYAVMLGAAVERQRAGSTARTLMRELQHRVKNDLQVVTALLSLESSRTDSFETRGRLESVASRVESLRLVHERLFAGGQVGRVDLADYIGALIRGRLRMHGLDSEERIRLEPSLAPVTVDHDQAVPIGMIVNEFMTNSLKYAFPMGQGVISAILEQPAPGLLRLVVADNGIGMPAHRREGAPGMGVRLIGMMVEQLGASAEWSAEGGTRLTVTMPLR